MKQKGFTPVLILVGILIIAGIIGGMLVHTNYSNNRTKTSQNLVVTSTFQPTPTSTPSPTPDEAVNWKTYTNNVFKFAFMYPSDIKSFTVTHSDSINGDLPTAYFYFSPGLPFGDADIYLNGISNALQCQYLTASANSFLDKAVAQANCNLPGVHDANEKILPAVDSQTSPASSLKSSTYTFYIKLYSGEKDGPYVAIPFPKAITLPADPYTNTNSSTHISEPITYYGLYFKLHNPKELSTFDQILSTFKFTQ